MKKIFALLVLMSFGIQPVRAERAVLFEDARVRVSRTTFLPGVEITRSANENTRWVVPVETDVVLREIKVERSAKDKAPVEKESILTWRLGETYVRQPEDKAKLLQVRYLNETSRPMRVMMFQLKEQTNKP